MKYDIFRKKMLLETGMIAAVTVVLSGIVYGLTTVSDSYSTQNQQLKSQVDSLSNDAKSLQTKYQNIQKNMTLYEEIKEKQALGELTITRQALMEKFNLFKKRFFLSSLKISMSSIADAKDASLKRKTSIVNSSEVTANIEAISDEHIYMLIKAMQRDLSGVSGVTKLSLSKTSGITESELRNISQNGPIAIVKGDMKFIWYGISPVDEKAPPAGAAGRPMPPGMPPSPPAGGP